MAYDAVWLNLIQGSKAMSFGKEYWNGQYNEDTILPPRIRMPFPFVADKIRI